MSDNKYKRAVKNRIPGRDWQEISSKWSGYIPRLDQPKSPPNPPLARFYDLNQTLDNPPSDAFSREITGLRQLLFQEGLFLFHKATNVISAAEIHARHGMLTWSLSNAYQGAFFGAKAIIRFLGVATIAHSNKYWIIDIYPELAKLTSKEKAQGLRPDPNTSFTLAHARIEHRHIWQLFQRLMRVSKFQDPIMNRLQGALSKYFDERTFAEQRNALHYGNNTWFFDDMYQLLQDVAFGTESVLQIERIPFENLESDFSMLLACVVLYFGIYLLRSLSEGTNKLNDDLALIMESLTSEWHPIYTDNLAST